jgi:glutathionyl-hydroquinone reductase
VALACPWSQRTVIVRMLAGLEDRLPRNASSFVFAALARLDDLLADRDHLTGEEITEADWRLLPTLLRFDAVYHTQFRCNGARLIEYEHVVRYTRDLFHQPGIAGTFALEEIRRYYYTTHDELNRKRIIPAGPLDLGFTGSGESLHGSA